MHLRAVLLLAVLALPTSAFALKGRVVDQQGRPVANATVAILGKPGEAMTDADGRFEWQPDPAPPFEILVIDAAGTYSRPILFERLDPEAELTVTLRPLMNESVTVTGSAPSIEATPAAGTTSVSGRDVAVRRPSNLMQAIENVAGVNQVSEGQAAVPAIRGLARGRTLILIDGARVSSERRVGPSATYLDSATIEGVDVARGPGSVAYGSDAFGGVISVRTRRVAPGSPWAARRSAARAQRWRWPQRSRTWRTWLPSRRIVTAWSKSSPRFSPPGNSPSARSPLPRSTWRRRPAAPSPPNPRPRWRWRRG